MDIDNKNLHNVTDMIEHNFKADNSISLLKQKMWKTHDLINQFKEKVKEVNHLKSDLEITKKEAKNMISNYKTATDKIKEIELNITEDKEENKKLKTKIDEYEINIAADKQNIQQLECKIKEMESEHSGKIMEYQLEKSCLEEKIRDLEHDLKKSKLTCKKREKKISVDSDADNSSIIVAETKSSVDVGINVSLCDNEVNTKPKVEDKGIMTDEFYNTKDDPYPLFCAKCEAHLSPAITPEKIYKTMSAYPELIGRDFFPSPKEMSSCSLSNTHLESTNRNQDGSFRTLLTPHPSPCSQYTDSTIGSLKPQLERLSAVTQSSENIKLRNVAAHLSANLSDISATLIPSQSINCTRKDSSDDFSTQYSLSIKEMERKIQSLESKMKKFRKFKRKQKSTNSCCSHHVANDNSGTLLNSDILSAICRGVAQYYNEKREIYCENERSIESEKCKCGIKKIKSTKKKLNKYACEHAFSWQLENLNEEDSLQDTFRNKFEDVTKAIHILPSRKLCPNKSNPTLNVNTSNMFLNNTNKSDNKREFVLRRENVPDSAEAASAEDSLMTSPTSIDEIYRNTNLLSKDNNIESVNTARETILLSSNDEESIGYTDSKNVDTTAEGNKIKKNNQDKEKYSSRLLKKIRNLKRKTQTNHKQENVESCLDHSIEYFELGKKVRIENKNEINGCTSKNIKDLKRNLNTQETSSINKQENVESDHYEPAKKLRIAHVPKTSILQLSVNQQDFTHRTIKHLVNLETARPKHTIQRLSAQIKKNSLFENKKDYAKCIDYTHSTDQKSTNEKNLDSTSAKDCPQNNDNLALPVANTKFVSVLKFDKCDDFSIEPETNESTLVERTMMETSTSCDKSEQAKAKGDERCDDHAASKDINVNDGLTSNRSAVSEATHHESYNHDTSDRASKIQYSYSPPPSGIITDNCVNDSNSEELSPNEAKNAIECERKETRTKNEMTEMQITETQQEDMHMSQRDEEVKSIHVAHVDANDVEEFQTPMCRLTKYISMNKSKKRKMPHKKMMYICKLADKFVKKQLQRLKDHAWEDSVHYDVIQKLKSTCGPRILAKCIVEYLMENVDRNDALDKSFTPPAPLMTTFEQKITALLVDLEVSKPTVVHFVQAAIEYKLFRLDSEVKMQVESLTRMYVILSRIQKDRERVRMMCCNALYCMGLKSISVLYTVLTCWPEILPNAEATTGILPKCIAFLVGSQQAEESKKLHALKSLIFSRIYNYSYSKEAKNNIVKEFKIALKAKQTDGLNTAIVLVAKREGPSWAYKNIIRSDLLPMIIDGQLPCIYSAFSLLGRLMRAFPLEDKDNVVQEIIEQLRDLIQSGQGSDDQQEGIISALLSLSRHKFDIVAQCVIKWTPNKSLRSTTIVQLEALINARNAKFWKDYLRDIRDRCIESKT